MGPATSIRYMCFPRTEPPPAFVAEIVGVFCTHEPEIGTIALSKGFTSDQVLLIVASDLAQLGFDVEFSKHQSDKIRRPVFFGENAQPTLTYEIDAYHRNWRCGLEVEAGRGWMRNAVCRDLIQAMVMVEVDTLVLAVSNAYKYKSGGHDMVSRDYEKTSDLAEALFGHSRIRLPYRLVVIGY